MLLTICKIPCGVLKQNTRFASQLYAAYKDSCKVWIIRIHVVLFDDLPSLYASHTLHAAICKWSGLVRRPYSILSPEHAGLGQRIRSDVRDLSPIYRVNVKMLGKMFPCLDHVEIRSYFRSLNTHVLNLL